MTQEDDPALSEISGKVRIEGVQGASSNGRKDSLPYVVHSSFIPFVVNCFKSPKKLVISSRFLNSGQDCKFLIFSKSIHVLSPKVVSRESNLLLWEITIHIYLSISLSDHQTSDFGLSAKDER